MYRSADLLLIFCLVRGGHEGLDQKSNFRCSEVKRIGRDVLPHRQSRTSTVGSVIMLNDREKILSALREKAMKVREIMKRANMANEEACQTLLLKMRDEGLVKFDIHKGQWFIG
jgi:hypothetical protein